MAINICNYLLNVLYSFSSNVAVIKWKLLYLWMHSQTQTKLFYTFISDWIVVHPEFDDVTFLIEEHFTQKLTTKRRDFIIHQIKKFNRIDFFNIIANGPHTLILQIDFPEPNFFQMRVLNINQGFHKRSYLQRAKFLPELQLNYQKITV